MSVSTHPHAPSVVREERLVSLLHRGGTYLTRYGLALVLLWIGG